METGDTASTRGSRTQGVRNFLHGGSAGNYTAWVGSVGTFGDNGEEGGRDIHLVPSSDHGEAIKEAKRRYMGDAWGRKAYGRQR